MNIFQRLNYTLFGADYIYWKNSADEGVSRVYTSMCGKTYYVRYSSINVWDEIKTPEQVIWLTCHPSKYFRK